MSEPTSGIARTWPLASLVTIDPESLPAGTSSDFHFRYIDISAAADGRLRLPDAEISFRDAPSRARRIVRHGDVLMSTVRPNLRAFAYCDLPSGDYVASTGFAILRTMEDNDPRFILYSILSDPVAQRIESHAVGSNYPAINSSDVRRLEIPAFSPAQQRRIAEILGTVDEAIEATEALIAKQQQVKTGLMHDLFTRGLTPDGKLRPPRSEAPGLYHETPLGWLPREWNSSVVGAEFTVDSGITLGPHRRPRLSPHPYLRVANVHRDRIELDDIAHLEASRDEIETLRLKSLDLLIVEGHANRMEIGRCAMVDGDAEGMLFQNHLFRLRPLRIAARFALLWLNSAFVQNYWDQKCATSSGLNTINRTLLRALPVVLPSPEEQEGIIDRLFALRALLAAETVRLAKLRQQKRGLMQDLLTGRVPVPSA